MKRFMLISLLCGVSTYALSADVTRIVSPDGLTYADIKVEGGKATYSAGYRKVVKTDTLDVQMVEDSPLGLYTNVGDFTQGLTLTKTRKANRNEDYTLRQGKQSQIHYEANTATFTLQNAKKHHIDIHFEVSNHNIAFRYALTQEGGESPAAVVVNAEATGFNLPADATAFICPQSDPMIGWKRTKPSYEEEYIWDEPATTKSRYGHGWTFPCLFHEGEKGWVLISETGVNSDYCGSHLSDATADGRFTIAFPMEGENNGFGSTGAQFGMATRMTPDAGRTPWRTLTISPDLQPIVETTIPWDVVEPLYEPSIDYKGFRNTWSWIIWQDPSIVYDDQVAFINLAADLGWEGCLIDGGWQTNIGRERMVQLFSLCKQKGIRPWVWYNSNGGWNDAPQCAKQCMHNPIVRKREMRWLRDNGVAGIKVDFFAGDKQETIRLYEQILSDANDYGIQVIFHGCTLPRGWERMYPNYCSSEAVLASENLVFNQHFDDMEGKNATLHPFCRNTVGSMEFGGTVLQQRLNRGNNGGTTRKVGDVFELGTAVVFQSSGQNFALTPMNLDEKVTPKFEIDFMRHVPTLWDETRLIDGYPGKYIILARRHANRWYVAALNAEKEDLKVNVQLPMLAGQEVQWLSDGKDGKSPSATTEKLDKKGSFKTTIPAEGGIVIHN